MSKVVILGGGVAGLSAAHELLERGFEVEVYESKTIAGGKARSIPVPGSGKDGRKDLPGEHGFRFFPSFYKHLPDTMKRIPYKNPKTGISNKDGVYGNLVQATRLGFYQFGQTPLITLAGFPKTLSDWLLIFRDLVASPVKFSRSDIIFFATRIFQILTSCEERRTDDYDKLSWWHYIDAENRSKTYQDFFANGLTRSLAAAQGQLASTKTIGTIFIQLFLDMLRPRTTSDLLLNGPTNEVWIEPWVSYLTDKDLHTKPVKYLLNSPLKSINCKGRKIYSVTVEIDGKPTEIIGDYYLFAIPVEAMANYITKDLTDIDPSLASIVELKQYVRWMNGIQFFLKEDVPMVRGHVAYVDSPWAVTSISQHQFWSDVDLSKYGDGKVRGILSADVSDWFTPGLNGKEANSCTREEIKDEVWKQMKLSVNVNGKEILKDSNIHAWSLDPDIKKVGGKPELSNGEPLLVNYVCTWGLRPKANTQVSNMFLASDYVQTFTDIACMEAANEAARRAVNSILSISNLTKPNCQIWDLSEPSIFKLWHLNDYRRWKKGLPWNGRIFW